MLGNAPEVKHSTTADLVFAPRFAIIFTENVRILTITSSYPKFDGDTTAPFVASITEALASRGHEITLVLPARSDLALQPIEGVRFCPYRYAPTEGLSVFGYAEALRADVALKGATYLAAPLALLSGATRLLLEARRERYDVLHAHWVVPNGTMAWPASVTLGLPLVVSLHGSDVFMSETKAGFGRAARLAFSRAQRATACSEDLATRSLALGAREKPCVIPYGVDASMFDPNGADGGESLRTQWGLSSDTVVVVAVGRLVHKKGFEYLIDAASKLGASEPRVHVLIVGKGDLQSELEQRAKEAGVSERVSFAGNVERDELARYYQMADILAVPSVRDRAGNVDGLPNVLLESMAAGRAIVASDVAGIPQALRSGRDGVLVPEKDAAALAEAIASLASSPSLRRTLGASARERARQEFNWNLAGERFESVLRSVAQASRQAS